MSHPGKKYSDKYQLSKKINFTKKKEAHSKAEFVHPEYSFLALWLQ